MMYRHDIPKQKKRRKSASGHRGSKLTVAVLFLATVAFALYAFVSHKSQDEATSLYADDDVVVENGREPNENRVFRKRLLVSEIPGINYRNIVYRELFNDSNYVQLTAARANGIDPDMVGDPAACRDLVPIFTNPLYKVDTMYHSVPYLVPEAVLLVDFISHRFKQHMADYYPTIGDHKLIVTSALRTESSERRLRRVNRNATDTSCHMYGTTFDISAQRYEHEASGRDTVVEACKQMLALALYEIRYEGLCYVKYERGSCFHITLISTQYEGDLKSEMRSYINPGSPAYLKTKSVPRPKPAVVTDRNNAKNLNNNNKDNVTSIKTKCKKKTNNKNDMAFPNNREDKKSAPSRKDDLSDRERLSLEQFERRGGM